MMRFSVLASGSRGNATIVESGGYRILIDCGLSLRELSRRLALIGLDPSDIHALLITHFHSDHVKGVPTVLEKLNLDIFSRVGFENIAEEKSWSQLRPLKEQQIGSFSILPLPFPHDNGGSFGFVISDGIQKLVFATDLGFATDDLVTSLQSADAVIIESNHDLDLLSQCAYPEFIKERIRSDQGHLSNCQCAYLLETSLSLNCQQVVLAHLSERANTPRKALEAVGKAVASPISAASQSVPSDWFVLESAETSKQISAVG